MRFELKKIIVEGDKRSASAQAVGSTMHASIFEIPAEAKEGDIVEASPIKHGGGCSVFYNFERFDK